MQIYLLINHLTTSRIIFIGKMTIISKKNSKKKSEISSGFKFIDNVYVLSVLQRVS